VDDVIDDQLVDREACEAAQAAAGQPKLPLLVNACHLVDDVQQQVVVHVEQAYLDMTHLLSCCWFALRWAPDQFLWHQSGRLGTLGVSFSCFLYGSRNMQPLRALAQHGVVLLRSALVANGNSD
jgi:hypothetical protein